MEFAFDSLASPIPLYRNLFKYLEKYGLTLRDIQADVSTLAAANLQCSLLDLNTQLRVKLDGFDLSFVRLHEIGETVAEQVLRDSWAALYESDSSFAIADHNLTLHIQTEIARLSYDELMRNFVQAPARLKQGSQAGVVFYFPIEAVEAPGEGSIVLDRAVGQKNHLLLKVNVAFDAKAVHVNDVLEETKRYTTNALAKLDLDLNWESLT